MSCKRWHPTEDDDIPPMPMKEEVRQVLVPVPLLEYCLQSLNWVRGEVGSENDRRCLQIERILKKDARSDILERTK